MTMMMMMMMMMMMAVFAAVDELQLALVTSAKASAHLVNVDVSTALAMPGVVGFLDHSSVPGSNVIGQSQVEEIFATSEVCTLLNGLILIKYEGGIDQILTEAAAYALADASLLLARN